jgi:hypothetical protein
MVDLGVDRDRRTGAVGERLDRRREAAVGQHRRRDPSSEIA